MNSKTLILHVILSVVHSCTIIQISDGAPLGSSWREECSRCPPGYGVVSVCNETVDTQCSSCPQGFYSNVTSATDRCLVCSKCGQGLFELYPCNATHDVFCELCSWTKAVNNDNYNSKCSEELTDWKVDDYVNSIPADYFDYGKGMSLLVDDLMLGDQPVDAGGNNETANVIVGDEDDAKKKFTVDEKAIENLDDFLNISLPSDTDAKVNTTPGIGDSDAENLDYLLNETSISIGDPAKLLNNTREDDYVETNNTNSLLPVTDNGTDVNNVHDLDLFPGTVVPNKTELQEDDDAIITGEQNTTNIHSASGVNIETDDDGGSGSGGSAIIIGMGDDVTGIQDEITTRRQEGDSSTTTLHTEPRRPTKLPTLPPVVGVSETSEPTKVMVHTEPPHPTRKLPTLPPVVGVSETPEPTKVMVHTEPPHPTRKLPTLPPAIDVSETPEPTKVMVVPVSVLDDKKGDTGNTNVSKTIN